MIVDCHTHLWSNSSQLGSGAKLWIERQSGKADATASPADHAVAAACADKTLVLGFRSRYLNADVPNDFIADYVRQNEGMIGIAGIDPTEDDYVSTAQRLLDRQEFRGLAISPALQNFHPTDSRVMPLYEVCSRRKAPLFILAGTHMPTLGRMEYARPMLLDQVALEYPELTMVVSSMGHPWVDEGIALIGKHPRVFADVAGLIRRPLAAHHWLVLAWQFDVADKILFGSDFPYLTAAGAIESLYRLHEIAQGTNLPTVPREVLRSIIERDALEVLGIARPGEQHAAPPAEMDDDDLECEDAPEV
jgi:predicted TIM-barrel fold metal-dependent hydrolase